MANVILDSRIIIRNDPKDTWSTVNPILLKGEMGVEIDTGKFKFGDGIKHWNDLEYASAQAAEISTSAPTENDIDYDIGTTWVNTSTNKSYILMNLSDGKAVWKQIVTPEDLSNLGAGDMLKAQYATNDKSNLGYVDKAIKADSADSATTAGKLTTPVNISLSEDVTGTVSFDGSSDVNIVSTLRDSGVTSGKYTKVTVDSKGRVTLGEQATIDDIVSGEQSLSDRLDGIDTSISDLNTNKQDNITGAASTITTNNLTADKVVVSNTDGKISTSTMDKSTLEGIPGRIDTLFGEVDNIPRYNYLTGLSASTTDDNISNQSNIDAIVIPIIQAAYTSPNKWDAVVVGITFTPSDNKKDAVYYYNGTSWIFLYYVSTGINRANGNTAGVVENSDDITFADGLGTVIQAGKVKNSLTIGNAVFDGSAPVNITSENLSSIIPIATKSLVGGVKSSSAVNQISVDTQGLMSLNTVGVAKLVLNGDTLILDGGNA